ncbi:MAG: nucleoside deaminase [Clostridia bacterium]|nr:nucleoside deaminase [Clostridia bacterium]
MHEVFMKRALSCAKKAAKIGEGPVGAVVVRNGEVVSTGYNRRETDKNALRHAEITAIDRACKKLGGWRLWECDLYVTLEPCPMCAGAIINSRIRNVYVGAPDPKNGAMGSVVSLQDNFTHKPNVVNGIMKDECAAVLSDFFKDLRERKRNSRSQNG